MFDKIPGTALNAVGQIAQMMNAARAGSLIEYTRMTRVEPVTLVDETLTPLSFMPDLMQSLNSIFAAYYLQAISLSVAVGNVNVLKLLDAINPNRDPLEAGSWLVGQVATEALKYQLPVPGEAVGLEAYGQPNVDEVVMRDARKAIQDNANLSVGKLLEVEISSGGQKATFPVAVRLIVSSITVDALVHTLSIGNTMDRSAKERFHDWRAGAKTFMKDLILCQDLIDEHRKALMNDKTGFYRETIDRRNKNAMAAVLTGSPSVSQASNIIVMSSKAAKQLEGTIHGRLSDFKTREKIFDETYVMLLAVVDPAWEQVTVYHRSIENPTELSARDLKGASKDTNVDIAKLLQAYHAGATPTL